jgi:hypothetical protein
MLHANDRLTEAAKYLSIHMADKEMMTHDTPGKKEDFPTRLGKFVKGFWQPALLKENIGASQTAKFEDPMRITVSIDDIHVHVCIGNVMLFFIREGAKKPLYLCAP